MPRNGNGKADPFGEAPLVVFTAMAIPGAGMLAAGLLVRLGGVTDPGYARLVMKLSAALVGGGIAASIGHLGRRSRAHLALRRVGASMLSSEVLLAAATLGFALAGFAVRGQVLSPLLQSTAEVCGMLLLIALGSVYDLKGQHGWRGPAARIPVVQGTAFGMLALTAFSGMQTALMRPAAVAFILMDVLFHRLRWRRLDPERFTGEPAHPAIFAKRRPLLRLHLIAGDLLPLIALLSGATRPAVALFAAGIVLDRVLFYGLALQHTQEAEIGHIERLIRS